MSMKALRSTATLRQVARPRLVRPSNSECYRRTQLTLVRFYATEPTPSPNRYRNGLVQAAMTGVLTGFVIAFVNDKGWLTQDVRKD